MIIFDLSDENASFSDKITVEEDWKQLKRSVNSRLSHQVHQQDDMLLLWALTSTLVTISSAFTYYEPIVFKPCPKVIPYTNLQIEELKGLWHLSLLILDASKEDLEESDVCVNGMVIVYNSTHMKQTWDMFSPRTSLEPVGTVELFIDVVTPGVWSVETPLGTKLSATMFDFEGDYITVSHCGFYKEKFVHLWTATATRTGYLTPEMRVKISSTLLDNNYDPGTTKMITWNKC